MLENIGKRSELKVPKTSFTRKSTKNYWPVVEVLKKDEVPQFPMNRV